MHFCFLSIFLDIKTHLARTRCTAKKANMESLLKRLQVKTPCTDAPTHFRQVSLSTAMSTGNGNVVLDWNLAQRCWFSSKKNFDTFDWAEKDMKKNCSASLKSFWLQFGAEVLIFLCIESSIASPWNKSCEVLCIILFEKTMTFLTCTPQYHRKELPYFCFLCRYSSNFSQSSKIEFEYFKMRA